jgi:hypothetical protein
MWKRNSRCPKPFSSPMKARPITIVTAPRILEMVSLCSWSVQPKWPNRAPPETKTAVKPSTKSEAPATIRPRRACARSVPVIPVTYDM